MKILAVGDLVSKIGLKKLEERLQDIVDEENIDFVIVNAENVADGMGITEKDYKTLLTLPVDMITMGNHTWGKKDIFKFINEKRIIRPANYPSGVPGKGYEILTCKDKKIAVINLLGRVSTNVLVENPFLAAEKIVRKISKEVDIIVIDMHAEATAEKIALARYLDGKVTIVFGTHTHVQTADDQIFEKGTAYITDIGMTGPKESVIGMDIAASIKRFVTTLPERYKSAEGDAILNACIFEINDETCRVEKIQRIYE